MTSREIKSPLRHPLDGLPKAKAERKKSDGRCEALCDYFREALGGDLDNSEIVNRRAAWTLILRCEKKDPECDAVEIIKTLIDVGLSDQWHRKNVTNFPYLVNHGRQIANAHREQFTKRSKLTDALAKANERFAGQSGRSGTNT